LVQSGWRILAGIDARASKPCRTDLRAKMRKTTMKRLLSAIMALTLLGGTAATAAPIHHVRFVPGPTVVHSTVVHYAPRPHVWIRGERFLVPPAQYVVLYDWNRYHLRRPPYGYRWVRHGHNFLLVSRANGFILDVRFARI
jgi:Ni/Co efflux regulator RcnB